MLRAGFSRVNITPSMGIPVLGYYIERRAEGVLDELEVNALALSINDELAILVSVDICELEEFLVENIEREICSSLKVKKEQIFLHTTHTHTGPGKSLTYGYDDKLLSEYFVTLSHKITDAVRLAIADLKPAKVGFGCGIAPKVAFIRRFLMKDGTVETNPGVDNPNILRPLSDVDDRVEVLRIDRDDDSIVVINFGLHPDTVGGSKISGDWPNFARYYVEKTIDGTKCIFFNGAQGDVNHVNVRPTGGDFNGLIKDFDGCSRGYEHTKHIGRVVAGAVLQAYDKVNYVEVDSLKCIRKTIHVPSNMPTKEELKVALEYDRLHKEGRDDMIPYKGMMLTTVVAEASRMVSLQNGPTTFPVTLSIVKIGKLAFVGCQGEPFTDVGRLLKDIKGFDKIFPCCLVNGGEGYYPTAKAYDEGGYEARSSKFKKGVGELLVGEVEKALNSL